MAMLVSLGDLNDLVGVSPGPATAWCDLNCQNFGVLFNRGTRGATGKNEYT